MKNLLITALWVLLLVSCNSHSSEQTRASNYQSNLDQLLDVLDENDKFMGNVTLSHEGKSIYSKSVGFSNIESKMPITSATKFRIGSVSKMFTATLIFKAIEEGKLSLDQTLESYFPEVENASSISVEHLLCHQSGVYSYTKDEVFRNELSKAYQSPQDLMSLVSGYPSKFEPGTQTSYSNSGYFLLALLLEEVYDKGFDELIAAIILVPLELTNTYLPDGITSLGEETNSYRNSDGWVEEDKWNLSVGFGAGSIVSTPNDLNTFIEALFNERIISKESLNQMTTIENNFGRGIIPFSTEGHSGFGHGGVIEGFKTMSFYFPEEKLALAVTANALDYNMDGLVTDILKGYFNESFVLPVFGGLAITAGELEKYIGVYEAEGLPGKYKITMKGNTLFAQLEDPAIEDDFPIDPLVYKGNHKFTNEEIGANLLFEPGNQQLGLEQQGISEIYIFSKAK
ncbi:MAG: serine hydrolase domain-containing protein [Cytophagales bacterium]|nr:serine hydrolase domain-containing protein [Cytophagales bacterium]